jgi:hypothetical protein
MHQEFQEKPRIFIQLEEKSWNNHELIGTGKGHPNRTIIVQALISATINTNLKKLKGTANNTNIWRRGSPLSGRNPFWTLNTTGH